MPTVKVDLNENDIRKACEYWATHRVLNVGRALSSELHVTVCNGKPTGTLNSASVWIETDFMVKNGGATPTTTQESEDA